MIEEFGGDFIQWMRGFYCVVNAGSMSGAERDMGRRQPTISHQVKCLEQEFGVELFDRSSRKQALTPEGERMYQYAITLFDTIKEMKDDFGGTNRELKGRIAIASTHALVMYYLGKYVTGFSRAHPDVHFELEGGMQEMIVDLVDSGWADFGLLLLEPVQDMYTTYPLFQTGLSLIGPADNRFGISPKSTLKEIARLPFIYYPPVSTLKFLVDRRFAREGLTLNPIIILKHFSYLKQYTALGMGVSIVFDYGLTQEDQAKLKIISMKRFFGDIPIGVITRRRKYLSPAVRAFLRFLKPDLVLD